MTREPRDLDRYKAEDWIPALKFGAKIDAEQNIDNGPIFNVEVLGVPVGEFKTINLLAGTAVDAGDNIVDIDFSGSTLATFVIADSSTASAPSITFNGDLDTGIFQSAPNAIGFTIGGSHRFDFTNTSFTLLPYGNNPGETTSIRYRELVANGTNSVGFKAPDAIASDVTWVLPNADGTSGQVLSTNGSGVLSWTTVSGGGSQASIQFQDEGVNLGTSGTVTEIDFTGNAVEASRVGNKLTVDIPNPQQASTVAETITQTAHGFTVGQLVRSSGVSGEYTIAQGNTSNNSEVVGMVTSVINANRFILTKIGSAPITTGYSIGDSLWLDETTAGAYTNIEPTGLVKVFLGYVVGTNEITLRIDNNIFVNNYFTSGQPIYDLYDNTIVNGNKHGLELSDGTFFIFTFNPATSNYCITRDKTKVYSLTVVDNIGSTYDITLEEYINNGNGSIGTLNNTYTITNVPNTAANNNMSSAVFVEGNTVFIPKNRNTTTYQYTEWTLSGSTLINPVQTNLQYTPSLKSLSYWFYDGTYYYISAVSTIAGSVSAYTYTTGSGNFVSVPAQNKTLANLASTQILRDAGAGVVDMLFNYFRIVGTKIGNFCSLKTTSSTQASPELVSGLIYVEE